MNDFINLMNDPAYKKADTEAHDDAKRRHEERVARNTAPENTRTAQEDAAYRQKETREREEARGKPTPHQLRAMITKGREFHFEHAAHRRRTGVGSPQQGGNHGSK